MISLSGTLQGSTCADHTSLYPVEPIADPGYWRLTLNGDEPECTDLEYRTHRAKCWSFAPCSPSDACEGDNVCKKGCKLFIRVSDS